MRRRWMRGALARLGPALALALVLVVARRAEAQEISPLDAKGHVDNARREGFDAFCTNPPKRLFGHQRSMCPLAAEVKGCEALVASCRASLEPDAEPRSSWLEALASIAQKLVWVLVVVGILAIAYPLFRLLRRSRADRSLTDAIAKVEPVESPEAAADVDTISDAEAALRAADDLVRKGELDRAMSLYLAASLVALDRRGAVRLARHRTNGEYVRLCAEEDARQPLREIVREVDKIEFGDVRPTEETAARVATRAQALVRRAASTAARAASTVTGVLFIALVGALAAGCDLPRGGPNDPLGDELPREVLRRSGYVVTRPDTSLATIPVPTSHVDLPVLVVDRGRVSLDDEARAHLSRWVEAGGVLVLFGAPSDWPEGLDIKSDTPSTRELELDVNEEVDFTGAKVATPAGFTSKGGETIARLGEHVYAARFVRGGGAIVIVAGSDLFTNVGVAIPSNAAALVAIVEAARGPRPALVEMSDRIDESTTPFWSSRRILVARDEDGIAPPSNPFSSLARAGLGKGLWHGLAATLVLFLAFGIRHARPRPTAAPSRRAFTEHVEATGAFYGRTRAFGHALAAYGRFAELRLRERLPRGADPIAFLASRANVPAEDVARIWTRATTASAEEPARGDELVAIRELRALVVKAL